MIWLSVKRDVFMEPPQKKGTRKFHFWRQLTCGGITESTAKGLFPGLPLAPGGSRHPHEFAKILKIEGSGQEDCHFLARHCSLWAILAWVCLASSSNPLTAECLDPGR